MIEHIVLIRWKETTPSAERQRILEELQALKDKILGIVRYHVGHNVSSRSLGYHAAISSTFVDAASLQAYGPHPEHQRVATQLRDASDSILAVDFELSV